MKPELVRRKIAVRKSTIHGYGVFADEDLNSDEVIEECYTLKTQETKGDFSNYFFANSKDDLKPSLLPLGSGCIYNHSYDPNAEFSFDSENQLIIYKTIKPIKKGQEIFISYGSEWFSDRHIKEKYPSFKFRMKKIFLANAHFLRFGLITVVLYLMIYLLKTLNA